MTEAVIDASAVIAYLKEEPGGAALEPYLADACMSAINYAEVIRRFCDRAPVEAIRASIDDLDLEIVPLDRQVAEITGELNFHYRGTVQGSSRALSYADCACLATGMQRNAAVITADGPWLELDRSLYGNPKFENLTIVNLRA
jgi:ribonuclease VapC